MGLVSSSEIEGTLTRLLDQQTVLIVKIKQLSDKNTDLTREIKMLKDKIEACLQHRTNSEEQIARLKKENAEMRSRLHRIDSLA